MRFVRNFDNQIQEKLENESGIVAQPKQLGVHTSVDYIDDPPPDIIPPPEPKDHRLPPKFLESCNLSIPKSMNPSIRKKTLQRRMEPINRRHYKKSTSPHCRHLLPRRPK